MNDGCKLIIGCGYVGRRAAALWRTQGVHVHALTRGRADELARLGLDPLLGDVTAPDALPPLPRCATVLYAVGHDRAAGRTMHAVYVDGLIEILARLPGGERFIYISSTGVYGDANGAWVDEATPPAPVDEAGRVVLEAEATLRQRRPDAIILRLAGIYGPGRRLREGAIRAGEPIPADPAGWLNLIHVDDAAATVLAAEQSAEPGGIYNIADGSPVTRGDFYRCLAERLEAPPPRFVPAPAGDRGNRRVSNRRMRHDLAAPLRYPDYRAGLAAT